MTARHSEPFSGYEMPWILRAFRLGRAPPLGMLSTP